MYVYSYISIIKRSRVMPFYLSYIVFKEAGQRLGHASLAITEYDAKDLSSIPRMIFRVGLSRPSQVQLEDFITAKKGREFFHKTYPITEEELSKILITLNKDRNIPTKQDAKLRVESKKRVESEKPSSIPKGPEHNWITFNCKTYALSVMERAGIRDSSIENFGVDIPIASGQMHPLEFKVDDNISPVLLWNKECFIVEKRPGMEVGLEIKEQKNLAEEQKKAEGILNQIKEVAKEYQNYIKKSHPHNEKKEMLDQLAIKIFELNQRGGQFEKLCALTEIYIAFKRINLSEKKSVEECQRLIRNNLKTLEGFNNPFGKLAASIKQSIFNTGYTETISDTRLLIGKLSDFIEEHAYPEARVRYQVKSQSHHH
jgi:hypothetical protein